MGDAFDLANEWLFDAPDGHITRAYYTPVTGVPCWVDLMDVHVSELQFLGEVNTRSDGQLKLVRRSQVPDRPTEGATLLFGGITYRVKTAEPDEMDLNWQLDLLRTG